jgi:hypothetical protein
MPVTILSPRSAAQMRQRTARDTLDGRGDAAARRRALPLPDVVDCARRSTARRATCGATQVRPRRVAHRARPAVLAQPIPACVDGACVAGVGIGSGRLRRDAARRLSTKARHRLPGLVSSTRHRCALRVLIEPRERGSGSEGCSLGETPHSGESWDERDSCWQRRSLRLRAAAATSRLWTTRGRPRVADRAEAAPAGAPRRQGAKLGAAQREPEAPPDRLGALSGEP